ncbi:MAG TPA: NAD-dependent epimerase/dehydratase family protein [Aeromicrobium sp.]|nr:NAD-dependent epimerase/dehydratase family protein [Aeromicrobium sp.]
MLAPADTAGVHHRPVVEETTITQRVFITGGCGFIGSNLIRRLLEGDVSVTVWDSLVSGRTEYLDGLGVDIVRGDIEDTARLTESIADAGTDVVVHLAASGNVVDSVADPASNFRSNAMGTFNVLDATRVAGVRRLVFSSTGGALIGNAVPPVTEESVPKPISPYGASKLAGEAYCSAFAHSYDMNTVALRFANIYGPFSGHKKGAITRFFQALHNGEPLEIYGDGTASRDFLYVDDLCDGIHRAIEADLSGATVAHVASGIETSVAELADACRRAAGLPEHPIIHLPPRPGEVDRNFASYEFAERRLGYRPRVPLDEGLSRTWQWLLEHELA